MKNFKKFLAAIALVLVAGLAISACSNQSSETGDKEEGKETKVEEVKKAGLTMDQPIKIDKENKTVTVLATVNGKYFKEGTRHAVVFKEGKFGDKPIFIAQVGPQDFHKALTDIGAVPGENMKAETAEKTQVEGDKLDVTVTWDDTDKDFDINEAIVDSNKKPIDMRFGGNLEAATSKKTGCLACLDSCPVGIVSNHTYPLGSVEKTKEVSFSGNPDVLPEDGTFVAVSFKLNK